MKSKAFRLLLIGILIFSVFIGSFLVENCSATTTTIYVDDDNIGGPWDGTAENPYQHIQDGIDASTGGDTVYVYSGEYNERIDVDKSIMLQGHSKYNTVINFSNLEITADYTTVKEFTLGTENTDRILKIYSNYTNIIDNIMYAHVLIRNSKGSIIADNTITSAFINLELCSNTTISNNNMANNNIEVSFQPIGVSDCSGDIVISGNNLEDVDYGISVSGTNSVTITDNTIKNIGYGGKGIWLRSSSSNGVISGNVIQDIPRYGYGIKLSDSSNNNRIYGNTFNSECNAYTSAYDECNNYWYNPSTSRGNYWDNYRGTDSNNDGIGDSPHNISGGNNKDLFPLGYFNNPPDVPLNPYPPNGAIDVEITSYGIAELKIDVSDPDDDCLIVCFYDATTDSLIGDGCYYAFSGDAFNGESSSAPWYGVKYNTTYSWYAVVSDGCERCGEYNYPSEYEWGGLETSSDIFSFTTQSEPQENKRPIANANGPYFGYVNTLITFNGSGSTDPDGTITMYTWDFGDGTESGHGISPTHNYSAAGNYTVYLAVKDDDGWADENTTTVTITELGEDKYPPIADANGPYSGYANSFITFNASNSYDPDGFIVSYEWDFGDGSNGTGMSSTHTYSKVGDYTVTLVVTDNQSLTDSDTTTVTSIEEKTSETPGFEIIFVIISIALVLFLKQKR
ncbi:MAG: PKD domain-containing protein [Thermoplasmatales archaeon]|nr:PKD domain-containing protein [Thermoplasmatales archaeon]